MIDDFYHFTSIRESDGDETFKAPFVLRFFVLVENVVGEIVIDAFVELFIIYLFLFLFLLVLLR